MERSSRRRGWTLSFIYSFKALSCVIAIAIFFVVVCSYPLYARTASSSPSDRQDVDVSFGSLPKRRTLSLVTDSVKIRLKEIRASVDYASNLVPMYASFARRLKLENSRLARNLAELCQELTDFNKNPSYKDIILDTNVTSVLQYEKEGRKQIKKAKQLISKAKESFDYHLKIQKLKDTIFSLNEQITRMKKMGELSRTIAAKAIPRNLHCLMLRLMQERIENPDKYISKQSVPLSEFEDPNLYHYAIFSDNVLAASVVVNSVVKNAKEPWKHVVHIVTDRAAIGAMQVMFKLKDYKGTHIEVKAVDDYTFLNSSYVPVLRQQESAQLQEFYNGNKLDNLTNDSTKLKFRNPKYLSILNHLRFYLPEMYPKLHKILFLDDDVVVQKDLTELWEIDMDGKVNGAVQTCFGSFHRYDKYLKFDHPLIKDKFDPKACAWAYGMNIFDLDAWRREQCTEEYHYWQDLNQNRTLWSLGTLPPGLITFYSTTKPLQKSWHVLGLGYNPKISEEKVQNAAVIHYNGDSKPWLANAIVQYQPFWTKYVDYDLEFVRACNIGP